MTRRVMINTYKREKKMKNLKRLIRVQKFANLKNLQTTFRLSAA